MVVLSTITSLFIGIQDPVIQKFAIRIAGGYLSEKTGAKVKIGKLFITPNFTVHIENVSLKDLKDNDIAIISQFKAKVFMQDIIDGNPHFGKVEFIDAEAKLIKYENEDKFNFQFIADAFKTDKPKKKDKKASPIRIDHIVLKNFDFLLWNQDKANMDKTLNNAMDYAHLDIDNIILDANDLQVIGDSIHANINFLSANELSGFQIKNLQGIANVSSKGILIDSLQLATNNSQLHLNLHMLYNDYGAFRHFVDSVHFDSQIYPTDITLSDIGVFAPVMYKMPDRIFFECRMTGPIRNFNIEDLCVEFGEETHFEGNMSMHPLDFFNGQHTLNINKMHYSYNDLAHFYIPGKTVTIPLPETLRSMGSGSVRFNFNGSYNDFVAEAYLTSEIGDVAASFLMEKVAGQPSFNSKVTAQRIDIGTIANASNFVGSIDLDAKVSGTKNANGTFSLDVNGDASRAFVLNNTIDKIQLNGKLNGKQFKGKVNIKDDELDLDFNGLVNFDNSNSPFGDFAIAINRADLNSLNILKNDSISILSTNISANFTGFNIDDLEGSLDVDSTLYTSSRGVFMMQHLDARFIKDNVLQRRITVNCDFFDYKMAGMIDFANMGAAFKAYLDKYAHIPTWDKDIKHYKKDKHRKEQEFFVDLTISNPRPLTELFVPALRIAQNTTLNGTFTTRSNRLNMTLRSKKVKYGKVVVDNFECKLFTQHDKAGTRFSLGELILRDSTEATPKRLGLENLVFENWLHNDSIFANLRWDDHSPEDHNKASISSIFIPTETGGRFNIQSAEMRINDSTWRIEPYNDIIFDGGRVSISDLEIFNNRQRFTANGFVPFNENDELNIDFNNFDISDFDLLFKGFDMDGFIQGNVQVSNLKNAPSVYANVAVTDFGLNHERLGNVYIDSHWNNSRNAIFMNASLVDHAKKVFNLRGRYNTSEEEKLDFRLSLDGLRMNVIAPFTQGIISRIQGYGKGDIAVSGSIEKPIINGEINIVDGGCKIDYLKTFYTFSPTIILSENLINFSNMVLQDTLGNTANVAGNIRHNYLKDFYFNLTLFPKNFLAMQTSIKDSPTYYGTAVADGSVNITGPLSDIALRINALTKKGTKIVIPFNNNSKVKENDFITFVIKEETPSDEDIEEIEKPVKRKTKSNFAINLDIDVTNDAGLRIVLPNDIGTIDAVGNGNIKIGSNSSGDFTLIGDYSIESGKLLLKYKNIISKTLKLQKGGTLSWVGDPTRGTLDVTGIYSTTATLSSLGITIDSSATNLNNVNVECLIHLTDQLLNPNITFGIRFPNASEDMKQSIFTILDTTNQSVMTQQAVSLLILNTFTNVQSSSSYTGNSGYLDVITSQFTNWISQLSENFDMGIHYKPGDELSNEEVQIALKTQLFNDRLTVETNFGMINQTNTGSNSTSNIVGEFDIYYKISKDGKLQAHFYNHSNSNSYFYNYTYDKLSPYTQGLGISYSHSFNRWRDLFKKKKTVNTLPFIDKKPKTK